MWEYAFALAPLILLGFPPTSVLVLQFALSLVGLWSAYKLLNIEPRLWHLFFAIPYFAMCSVKWPQAITTSVLPVALLTLSRAFQERRIGYTIGAGLLFGILLNMRSELLVPILFLVGFLFVGGFRSEARTAAIAVLIALATLGPWVARSVAYDGIVRFGTTNRGGVLYISLGQLPGNPWHIGYSDKYAFAYARKHGVENPWSPEGDRILTQAFVEAVERHPVAYVRKVAWTAFLSVAGGLYTGEYDEWIPTRTKDNIKKAIAAVRSPFAKARALLVQNPIGALLVVAEKVLFRVFQLVWFALAILLVVLFERDRRHTPSHPIGLIIASLLVAKIILSALVQYEPRHMTEIYLLVFLAVVRLWHDRAGREAHGPGDATPQEA
jgi:hypothetical protein